MPWARLDDGFWSHHKVVAAGLEATGLHCRALSYVSSQRTSGRLSREAVQMLAPTRWKQLAAKCVTAGLWHVDGDGWTIHDYDDPAYGNPTSSKAEARTAAAKKAANARWGNAKGSQSGCESHSETQSDRTALPAYTCAPSQSPVPVVSGSSGDGPNQSDAHEDSDHLEPEKREQLALIVQQLQPTWKLGKIRQAIHDARERGLGMTRLTAALLVVALSEDSQSPRRVLSDGFWWDENDTRYEKALASPRLNELLEPAS